MSNLHILPLALAACLFLPATGKAEATFAPPAQTLAVQEVTLSAESFNPAQGERIELGYTLTADAQVTVHVYDPEFDLIAEPAQGATQAAGRQRVTWNGRDLDGRVVPDEAYFFTIEAVDPATGATAVYDPVTFSGGEPYDLADAQFDREAGTVGYRLPQPSRVLVRLGIRGSALLRALVDWQPRAVGQVTEYWNGKDIDGVIDLWPRKFATLITYVTLPETSVITYGNRDAEFQAYKAALPSGRSKKPVRPMANARRIAPQFGQRLAAIRSFRPQLTFQDTDGSGLPSFADRLVLDIDAKPMDRAGLVEQPFEVIGFIDTVFMAEEERGYLPMAFPLELQQLPPGEHVVTINIATFDGRIGIASTKFKIER